MEKRTIEQVKVFKLMMNPMPSNFENFRIVALSYDEDKLKEFVENEKVEPYKDGKWHKTFKKGGPLEWMNPMNWNDNTGIFAEWATESSVKRFCDNTHNAVTFVA